MNIKASAETQNLNYSMKQECAYDETVKKFSPYSTSVWSQLTREVPHQTRDKRIRISCLHSKVQTWTITTPIAIRNIQTRLYHHLQAYMLVVILCNNANAMQNHLMRNKGVVHTFCSSNGVLTRVSKYPMNPITPAITRQITTKPCLQYKNIPPFVSVCDGLFFECLEFV